MITIDSNVPIPSVKNAREVQWMPVFDLMKVGDSFVVTKREANSVWTPFYRWRKKEPARANLTLTSRVLPDGKMRLWLVER